MIRGEIGKLMIEDGFQGKLGSEEGYLTDFRGCVKVRVFTISYKDCSDGRWSASIQTNAVS